MSRPLSILIALALGAVAGRAIPTAYADCMCSPMVFMLTPVDVPEPVCASDVDCAEGFTPEGALNRLGDEITLAVYPVDGPYELEFVP